MMLVPFRLVNQNGVCQKTLSFIAAAYLTISQSGKSTYSARIITHPLQCDEGGQSGGYTICECQIF